ncbi:traB domain-containing protein [Senna tora]|uniref:TraB domain-containing protein n=1 Tax=Senna tora TaxID=362788 RepID=A0A834SYH8_9FABA|nr:traB domain-containing protein [Senna tora]
MSRFLKSARLWRSTSSLIENQNHCHPSLSSATTSTIFFLTTRCSTTPDSKTLNNDPSSADFRNDGEGTDQAAEWVKRHEMARKMVKNLEILTCASSAKGGVCDVYVVGTVHISQKSCTQVQEIIKFLKPEVVFLELCSSRRGVLTKKTLKKPTVEEMVKNLRKQPNLLGATVSEELKVIPGSEFRVAHEEAIKYGGRVVFGDRPIKITLERAWRKMTLRQIIKLFRSPSKSSLNLKELMSLDLKELLEKLEFDNDFETSLRQEMSERCPSLMETIVHERDQYMSHALLTLARKSSSVVAVVGKGHLEGIKKHWLRPVMWEDLVKIPPKKEILPGVSLTSIVFFVREFGTLATRVNL